MRGPTTRAATPPGPPGRPSRRAVLGGLGAGVLAALLPACSALPDPGDVRVDPYWRSEPPPVEPDADELARRRAVASARVVSTAATVLLAAPGTPAGPLALVVDSAATHLDSLGEAAPAAAVPSTSPPAGADPAQSTVADLLSALAASAQEAVTDVPGVSAGLARLLAAVAASRALCAARLAGAGGAPAPALPTAADPAAPAAVPEGLPARGEDGDAAAAAVSSVVAGALAGAYGFEVVAAQLDDDTRAAALGSSASLRRTADDLAAALEASGRSAPAPAPGYALDAPLQGEDDAVALAVTVEDRLTATALDAVPATVALLRSRLAVLVVERTVAAATWRAGDDPALPGTAAPA